MSKDKAIRGGTFLPVGPSYLLEAVPQHDFWRMLANEEES